VPQLDPINQGTSAMSLHFRSLRNALIPLLLGSAAATAQGGDRQPTSPTGSAIETQAGHQIPAGALGVVLIDAPREASLLMLRGVAGSGEVVLRGDGGHDCMTLPVRFVAGDFGGSAISTRSAEPIRLILRSARVARALADGEDVVSDMYRVSSADDDLDADIIIQSGLSESHGFVLNPGGSVVADVLGVTTSRTPCTEI
jgi:hypothetical protein